MGKDDEAVCDSCLGHGYRVEIAKGWTVNAPLAADWRIKGKRKPCLSCAKGSEVAGQATETVEEA